jgi:hypothetical protein
MIKIAMTIRNRLAVSKKAIEALYRHTTTDFQLYVYDNRTNYKVKEHFEFFWKLYNDGMIHQLTFNTKDSVYNAFDKAVALNNFGYNHSLDPNLKDCDFIVFLDNDMLVLPEWDVRVKEAWDFINKRKMNHIKVVAQCPGGIKNVGKESFKIGKKKVKAITGKLSGSGFWAVRPNFYKDIGFLDIKPLIGLSKKHDQKLWQQMNKRTKGKDYIMGLNHLMVLHTGSIAGSICNTIGYGTNKNKEKKIRFEKEEALIEDMTFDQFYNRALKECSKLDK